MLWWGPERWPPQTSNLIRTFKPDPSLSKPGKLEPIDLPEEYLKASGEHARQRVVAAGLRLAAILQAKPAETGADDASQLGGEWSMVSGEANGFALPENLVKTGKRIAKDGETQPDGRPERSRG